MYPRPVCDSGVHIVLAYVLFVYNVCVIYTSYKIHYKCVMMLLAMELLVISLHISLRLE